MTLLLSYNHAANSSDQMPLLRSAAFCLIPIDPDEIEMQARKGPAAPGRALASRRPLADRSPPRRRYMAV
jgi:hypothetical protein